MTENISLDILRQTLYYVFRSGSFFPYGSGEGDESYPANGSNPAVELQISASFPFFDRDHGSLYVRFSLSQRFELPFKIAYREKRVLVHFIAIRPELHVVFNLVFKELEPRSFP